jgi:hypothetical protein
MANKYKNEPTTTGGKTFASKKEAARYQNLQFQQRAGEITELKTQVPFKIEINGVLVCKYVADFTYINKAGKTVVEDVKGVKTPIYKLKNKLMLVVLGINILET